MTFSPAEFDLLLEAVALWETSPLHDKATSEVFRAILNPRKPGSSDDDMGRELKSRLDDAERENRGRRERGVMLRAKLIQLRDSAAAEAMTVTTAERPEDHE